MEETETPRAQTDVNESRKDIDIFMRHRLTPHDLIATLISVLGAFLLLTSILFLMDWARIFRFCNTVPVISWSGGMLELTSWITRCKNTSKFNLWIGTVIISLFSALIQIFSILKIYLNQRKSWAKFVLFSCLLTILSLVISIISNVYEINLANAARQRLRGKIYFGSLILNIILEIVGLYLSFHFNYL